MGRGRSVLKSISRKRPRCMSWPLLMFVGAWICHSSASAAEGPFLITYSHQMEEPGNLEIAAKSVTGKPTGGNRFLGSALEFEYGVKGWWTSEVYLDGQTTGHDSTLF